jgi:phage head maturation protease
MREELIELPALARGAEVRAATFDEKAHTVDVVWTTGATVRRVSFINGPYNEALIVGPENVRLARLNAGAPFLNSHDGFDLRGVIGTVVPGSARLANGAGYATVQLSRRQDVAGIVGDIRDGIIRNVSVGYRYHKVEKIEGSDGQLPTWRVVDWEPLEISAVAVPADAGAQIRSEEKRELFPCIVAGEAPAAPLALVRRLRMAMLARELGLAA